MTFTEQLTEIDRAYRALLARTFPDGSRELSIARTHLDTARLFVLDYAARDAAEAETA
jgi:hypothetical protein